MADKTATNRHKDRHKQNGVMRNILIIVIIFGGEGVPNSLRQIRLSGLWGLYPPPIPRPLQCYYRNLVSESLFGIRIRAAIPAIRAAPAESPAPRAGWRLIAVVV